jgi:hypothetical protein
MYEGGSHTYILGKLQDFSDWVKVNAKISFRSRYSMLNRRILAFTVFGVALRVRHISVL